MKFLIFCLFIGTFTFSQSFNYQQKWKEIEVSENQGNFKLNLPKVEEILKQSQKDKNTKQEIKALFYYSKIVWQTENDEDQKIKKNLENKVFELFNSKIKSTKNIENALYSLILANLYDSYFQQNHWNLQEITSSEIKSEDFRTWNEKEFYTEIKSLYENAFHTKELLKQEKIKNWEYLMTQKDKDDLMPTLFDFFVYDYLKILNNYNFSDEISQFKKSEKIKYQNELIEFHKDDSEKSAYLYLLGENFLEENLTNQEKSKKLENLANENKTQIYSSQILYQAGNLIQNENPKEAFRIANKVINEIPKNKWIKNNEELIKNIQSKNINFVFNETSIPNENIPIKINYKNIKEIEVKIYEVTPNLLEPLNQEFKENLLISKTKKFIRTEKISLKYFDDFKTHSTIFALNPLPKGIYQFDFSNENASEINSTFYLNIFEEVLMNFKTISNNQIYRSFNRNSGNIISNQEYILYKIKTDYQNKTLEINKIKEIKSSKNGTLNIENLKNDDYYIKNYLINKNTKELFLLNNQYYYSNEYDQNQPIKRIDLFLDRAIYRPGQKVYFKGILYENFKGKSQILKNQNINIRLKNVNYETIANLELTTNDFGSIFGEFILPNLGLNGEFNIETDFGSKNFSVEEYKRPKFEVTFNKEFLKDKNFVLDSEVKIQGKTISFAGSSVSEAKVKYRVTRKEVFLYRFCWFPTQNSPEEIVSGEVKTQNDGTFEIPFIAKSSLRNEYKLKNRSYVYEIFADVTDINGETQSGNFLITIGDLPKKLDLITKNKFEQKELTQIKINSTDLNDIKTPSKGNLIISKLINPNTKIILPNQNLDEVEYQLYDEKRFDEKLPNYLFNKELDKNKWKKEAFYQTEFNTEISDSISVKNKKFDKGFYLIEAISMYKSDSIQTQKIIEITNNEPENVFFDFYSDKNSYKIGEEAEFTFLSNLPNISANFILKIKNKELLNKEISFKNGKATEKLLITNEYLNGISAQAFLMKYNSYENKNLNLEVLEKSKDLKIETKTFRSKIEPGSKQNWELLISGNDKDKVLAEVLATMYDFSLDKFKVNLFSFNPNYKEIYYEYSSIDFMNYFNQKNIWKNYRKKYEPVYQPTFYDLNTFGFDFNRYRNRRYDKIMPMASSINEEKLEVESFGLTKELSGKVSGVMFHENSNNKPEIPLEKIIIPQQNNEDLSQIKTRTNLQETAFFYPNLMTDENGNVKISFISPESLTKWKMLVLAHTKDLNFSTAEFYTQTQKELMISPNVPRFLREGDKITISTKIDNLSDKNLSGNVQLFLNNSLNNKELNLEFKNENAQKSFSVEKGKATNVSWQIEIPKSVSAVTWKIVAKADNFSDGEENILPILTNRMLVTETLPISIKENQNKIFILEKLKNNSSSSLENFNLSLQMTTNPIWNAVFSLPYLREFPYECSEQVFARLYGNILSSYILNSSPKIKKVFEDWNLKDFTISNLEKNPELKNILLEETPWIRDAQSETEQIKRIALFFDLNKMSNEMEQAQNKLLKKQMSSGGFSWFEGGKEDFYITNHILGGFGKLQKMLKDKKQEYLKPEIQEMISKMIVYSDNEAINQLEKAKKYKQKLSSYSLSNYFYARSFWLEKQIPTKLKSYLNEYLIEIQTLNKEQNIGQKAQNSLILNRFGKSQEAKKIVNSLKEISVLSDETGMYWKNNISGWYFYEAPIENQAILIEAFSEVSNDEKSVEEMKIWLLKNKQTNSWNSTKSTTEAIYSLMNFGKSYLNSEEGISIKIGNDQIYPTKNNSENISGYFKQSWKNTEITKEKAIIQIEKKSPGITFGGLFWQYFENLDKITTSQNKEIAFDKKLYIKEINKNGEILKEITENYPIKIGDKITVELVIKVSRDMEYIHIKDGRASGFEPLNVISEYKYQNGIGYYESTKDASTNFFINNLSKGIYVFEYDLRANNSGNFSNGITQLQNMYAPEMSAHSEGNRVEIINNNLLLMN